jgi:hypothetical protein
MILRVAVACWRCWTSWRVLCPCGALPGAVFAKAFVNPSGYTANCGRLRHNFIMQRVMGTITRAAPSAQRERLSRTGVRDGSPRSCCAPLTAVSKYFGAA